MSMNDVKSLSHSKWRCKYHIVFAPKYRRQIIYGRIKADVGKILRDLCNQSVSWKDKWIVVIMRGICFQAVRTCLPYKSKARNT